MFDLLGWLDMMDDYDQRKVARFEQDDLMVDTAEVTDGDHPYETAVEHPDYNDGNMVIVQAYDTEAEAQAGHVKWVEIMTTEPLPDELVDCLNSRIAQVGEIAGLPTVHP